MTAVTLSGIQIPIVTQESSTIAVAEAAGSTRKCFTISSGNTNVYSDTGLSRYKGKIFGSDEVTVNAVYSRYSYVTYPISGNRTKSGYIPTSAILLATRGTIYKNNGGSFTTYKRPGGSKYGTSTKGDSVTILGTSGDYTQIKYNVSGGYKYAFAYTSDVDKYVKGNLNSESLSTAIVPNGTYTLVSALDNNYVLDISGGSSESQANCQLYQSNGTNAQKFVLTYNSDGYYTITNVGSGKVLDCAGGGWENCTNVWQYYSNSSAAQKWKIIDVSNGYYTLTCQCNGKCLDVFGGYVYNGNNIQIYEWNGENCQKWKLVPDSESGAASSSIDWDSYVGKTVADINSKYYTSENISYRGGYKGQCTWYAYGRFYELTGIKLGKARNAKNWLSDNKSNSKVEVTYDPSAIKSKSIAVRTTGAYGHVIFIENVTYNNGSPQYVYFTECNADGNGVYNAGSDCIVKKLSYSRFLSQKNPAGYISAK